MIIISPRLRSTPAIIALMFASAAFAQEHSHHNHGEQPEEPVERPKVYLDKSPRIVAYQLNRLSNQRLLLVERHTTDAKYAPVYSAILTRAGMSRQHRDEALHGLVTLNKSDAVTELLGAVGAIDDDDRQQARVGRQLATILLDQPESALQKHANALQEATSSDSGVLRAAGYAGLITAGDANTAWQQASGEAGKTLDFLAAIPLVPHAELRSSQRAAVVESIAGENNGVRRAAIQALASVPAEPTANFDLLAPLFGDGELRTAAVRTMLTIDPASRNAETSATLADQLVNHAEATPAADRTSNDFVDAMELADQLLARLPTAKARSYRERLRAVTVRVVRIHTVEEEMRYDIPYFAVEAGRDVQIVLANEDLMPHNLVVTVPGALQDVAIAGAALGTTPGRDGKLYVPDTDQVLHATSMVQPEKQERLTFTAPTEPGEYPYVCTFPRHWMRMYGVMVVVEDLDAFLKNPIEPKDPTGNNRSFVQAWTLADFAGTIEDGLRGRLPDIGARIFKEATCASCHKMQGQGGAVGPELTDIMKRWKGDRAGILREILEPSHKIDPKYAVHIIITDEGLSISGIVQAEEKDTISILENPEAKEPRVVERDSIDDMVKSDKSMMPKALLDRFTKDEVFELLAWITAER